MRRLTATDHHPFWSPSANAWVDAADLQAGMVLRAYGGDSVTVSSVRSFSARHETRNLTIDGLHTYYVLAGQVPVLVHNAGGSDFDLTEMDRPGFSNYALFNKDNQIYYVGLFGPDQSPAKVQKRHSKNNNRFSAARGDRMVVYPGTRTYGRARLVEQRMMEAFGTFIGKAGSDYRGNRQNPMNSKKEAKYLAYEKFINGGCP
ncbi:polymorphic toxin-type HINT domain-containing protein [Streptomyces fructofermentans]|uniref:polymorphic toxin-type HINT domain-containing protein n=1 Tax=Streptomyces fructofermentans TaxID=152141 RepID=UPI003793FAE4